MAKQRRRCFAARLTLAASIVAFAPVLGRSQPPDPPNEPPNPAPARSEGDRVKEAGAQVWYLRDAKGQLQPVLNFSLEEFERLREFLFGRPPTHRIEHVAVRGEIHSPRREAKATVSIRIVVESPDWVRVPLRLENCILAAPIEYRGPGKHRIEIDENTHEVVAWLQGESAQPHELDVQVWAPVEVDSRETRVAISLPRGLTSSAVWTAPGTGLSAKVSAGAVVDAVREIGPDTEFQLRGVAGDFFLAVGAQSATVDDGPALDVEGALASTIRDDGVHTRASLVVKRFGQGPLPSSLAVRLPPGAALESANGAAYKLTPPSADGGLSTEVVFATEGLAAPLRLELAVRQQHQLADPAAWIEMGGFEVAGVPLQTGSLEVFVDDEWRVSFGELRHVLRARQPALPAADPVVRRNGSLAGRFLYSGQPFSVPLRVRPRTPIVNVDPEFEVEVLPGRATLLARLNYLVLGGSADTLEIHLGDWQFDALEPLEALDADALSVVDGVLTAPLLEKGAGQKQYILTAHRDLPVDATRIDFSLPRPIASSIGAAALRVASDSAIVLTPRDADLMGLAAQSAVERGFAYRAEIGAARFSADYALRAAERTVRVRNELSVGLDRAEIKQSFVYRGGGPVDAVELHVPAKLLETDGLTIECNGQALSLAPPAPDARLEAEAPLRYALPAALSGEFEVHIAYSWPLDATSDATEVPLVTPSATCDRNELTVTAAPGLTAAIRDGLWERVSDALDRPGATWRSQAPRDKAVLEVQAVASIARGTIVERAWLQSVFTSSSRRDRAAFRFTSGEPELRFWLPADVVLEEVILDGERVPAQEGESADERLVTLSGDDVNPHRLEIRYRFTRRTPIRGWMSLESIRLADDIPIRFSYWQVATPGDEHLVWGPRDFNREYEWRWQGVCWERRPLMNQAALERWSGAGVESALPEGMNAYLFSAASAPTGLVVLTASRSLLVLLASGVTLLAGLLVIYFPGLRRPGLVLAAGVALAAAAASEPGAAAIGGQAALLGLALTGMAATLESSLAARRGRKASVRPLADSRVLRDSTNRHQRPAPLEPPISTQTQVVSPPGASEAPA